MTFFKGMASARKAISAIFQSSLDFANNGTDVINFSDNSSMHLNNTYSFSFFVNKRSVGGGNAGRIIIATGFDIFFTGTNAMTVSHNGNSKTSDNNIFDTNIWTHIGATYDGSNVYFYRNGILFTTVAQTNKPGLTGSFNVGGWNSHSNSTDGKLQQLRVYKDRVLTATEIMSLSQGYDISTTGLSMYLKMDEGSGTTLIDSSGNNNTGTITGATWSTETAINTNYRSLIKDFTSRNFTSSLSWDGTAGIITLGSSNSFTGDLTFSCWMYWNGKNGGFQTIFAKRDAYDLADIQFSLNLVNTTGYVANDTIASFVAFLRPIPIKKWFYFSWVRNTSDSTEKIYVDNNIIASKTMGTYGNGINSLISIGATQSPSQDWFNGYMKEISIYQNALTGDQLNTLSNGGSLPYNPWTYLKLNEGYGTTATDSGPYGNNGTIDSASWSTNIPTGTTRTITNINSRIVTP